MTLSKGPTDPYVTSFESTVSRLDGREVVLSETYFYPEGGGQPADRGTIGGIPVTHVSSRDGEVVHQLEESPTALDTAEAIVEGATVSAAIDEAFRTYAMRAHTASHTIYGAGRRLFDDIGYGGFDIDDEKVRVDFVTGTDIDDDVLVELERLTNRTVWDSRPVSWEEIPKEKALDREEIAFNAATEEGVMDDAETIRVVTIEGWDVAACGGTHVRNTREIGPVSVLERSNPGEGLTRVEFAVGPTAIERRAMEHRAAMDASRTIGTNIEELPEEVERLTNETDRLEGRVQELTAEVLSARLEDLAEFEEDASTWQVGTVEGFEANAVGERIKARVGNPADAIAVVGADEPPFIVVATSGDIDADQVVEAVTGEFGGGGGGSPSFAQGGGLDADPDDVLELIRDWASR
ncbi:MAG: alanyl-tRNA editing protein [Halodesulfurarchaeum sp.]